ncbi:MAG TPA: histidine kinase [Clostridiales bacterium]|nr:histidine kinase [Clostridiales bacterium]
MLNKRNSIWNYIQDYKFNSLFIKYFLLILLLLILPLVSVSFGIYRLNGSILREEIGAAHVSSLAKVRDIMDMVMKEVDRLSVRISSDRAVERFLSIEKRKFPDYTTIDVLQNVSNIISISTSDYIYSIYVYSDVSNYIISTSKGGTTLSRFYDNSWLEEFKAKSRHERKWISSRKVEDILTDQVNTFITSYYFAPFYSLSKGGVVIVNLDVDKLKSFISNNVDDRIEKIYAVDKDGKILFSSDTADVGKYITEMSGLQDIGNAGSYKPIIRQIDGVNQVITQISSAYNDWTYISVTPLHKFEQKMDSLTQLMWLSIPVNILVAIIVAYLISVQVFQPIGRIMEVLDNPEEYYDRITADQEKGLNEFKYITMNIMKSFDENRQMEEELAQRMRMLKQAQTAALQSQINPHFLYNTLQTINWLVMSLTKGENAASAVIEDLSDILRVTMDTENYLIPIEDEVSYAKKYIEIQQIRYKNKFTVHWEMDGEIMDNLIAKVSLQPLIENSIYHGIKPKKKAGNIFIRGYISEGNIKIEVSDDGVGLSEEGINSLNMELRHSNVFSDKHIGVRNVNQRLKLIFGEEYGITLQKRDPEGLQVNIVIPNLKQYL